MQEEESLLCRGQLIRKRGAPPDRLQGWRAHQCLPVWSPLIPFSWQSAGAAGPGPTGSNDSSLPVDRGQGIIGPQVSQLFHRALILH